MTDINKGLVERLKRNGMPKNSGIYALCMEAVAALTAPDQLAAERGRVVEEGIKRCEAVRALYKPDCRFAINDCIDQLRALADPQQSDLPPGYTEIDAYIAEQEKDPARAAALKRARERAQSAQQNAEGA